ncbi:hypothetical protein BRARA_C00376 [Brassica rapa]|uniref:Uncharacterized protein n=1 Tax=Brassica campestris TaxID=3711 RepID=A0A397ZZB8_BRACM|nr:hypothetical protein BRARA_C00376 [Brassica rapa]
MEEASRIDEPNRNPNTDRSSNPNPLSSIISSAHVWPTIDGPLGLTEEASLFGPVWDKLVMYNVADRLGLSGLA